MPVQLVTATCDGGADIVVHVVQVDQAVWRPFRSRWEVLTGPESVRPERTQDGGSAAVPEVDGLPADGEAEQRLGAAAKVRTPTQLAQRRACAQWTRTLPKPL